MTAWPPWSCCKSTARLRAVVAASARHHRADGLFCRFRLLNANKIHCIRASVFNDLENLALLSLYDNKIQSLAKGTFGSLRSIQTL